jgi:hypothetical protein
MHQIRYRLGLRPRPRWGAHRAPQTPSWILGGLLLRGGQAAKQGGRGRERVGQRTGDEGGRGEREGPLFLWHRAPDAESAKNLRIKVNKVSK